MGEEDDDDDDDDDEANLERALGKTDQELYRELLRLYPTAELEDYLRFGVWKNDLMRTDLQLFAVHRREAGAPDPLPLGQVQVPPIPKSLQALPGMTLTGGGASRPSLLLGATSLGLGGIRLPNPMAAQPSAGSASSSAASSTITPLAELRVIALFVAKWKMDPTRTKVMLARLTPQRRRHVMSNFKSAAVGLETTTELEAYIAECEKTNSWGTSPLALAPAGARPLGVGTGAGAEAVGGATPLFKSAFASPMSSSLSSALASALASPLAGTGAPATSSGAIIRPLGAGAGLPLANPKPVGAVLHSPVPVGALSKSGGVLGLLQVGAAKRQLALSSLSALLEPKRPRIVPGLALGARAIGSPMMAAPSPASASRPLLVIRPPGPSVAGAVGGDGADAAVAQSATPEVVRPTVVSPARPLPVGALQPASLTQPQTKPPGGPTSKPGKTSFWKRLAAGGNSAANGSSANGTAANGSAANGSVAKPPSVCPS